MIMETLVPVLDKPVKKKRLPNGFLSQGCSPTHNSVISYMIYLPNLPEGWDITKLHQPSVEKVRRYFGVDYGFGTMLYWGINFSCSNSETSSNRYLSMNRAYLIAKSNLALGMIVTDIKIS